MKQQFKAAIAAVILAQAPFAQAGIYTDQLSQCLVESTTVEDRNKLVTWMFVAISSHPAVQHIATVKDEDRERANASMGQLMMQLMTESCGEHTKKAIKYEGNAAVEAAFSVLGQVAGREIFASPQVAASLSGLEKHVDAKKLEALLK